MVIPVKSTSLSSIYAQNLINELIESKEIKRRYKGLVIKEANEQILKHEAYGHVEFTKSADFKNEIINSFYNNLEEGIVELNKITEDGFDKKEALKFAITEDLFDNWYKRITNIADRY